MSCLSKQQMTHSCHAYKKHCTDIVISYSTLFVQRIVVPLATPSKFTHDNDYLVLEDESGRVKLIGGVISAATYVTGMSCINANIFQQYSFESEVCNCSYVN